MSVSDTIHVGYAPGQDVTLDRVQEQIEWYDRTSETNQKTFKNLKVCTISAAALIPLFAAFGRMSWLTAGLGVLIVVLEGLQQVNQYQSNWIAYRSTCETLKHEKFLYLAKAGIYASAKDPHALLAERVEASVSREHAEWKSSREQAKEVSAAAGAYSSKQAKTSR